MPIPDRFLHSVVTVEAATTAREAARAMRDHGVGALVAVDDDGRPSAIVTDRDLALTVLRGGLDPATALVSIAWTSPVVTLNAASELSEAAHLMRRKLVRRLPIVDDSGALVGIVTADDLVAHLGEEVRWVAEATRTGFRHEAAPPAPAGSTFGKE